MRRTTTILLLLCLPIIILPQTEVENNDTFGTANTTTTLGPFIGATDSDWQGDLWRLNLSAGSYTLDWTGDNCTRVRVVEYLVDPAIGNPNGTPGASSTCPPIGSFECHLVDNLGLGLGNTISESFTVTAGRFYFFFVNPHMCTNMNYTSGGTLPIELSKIEAQRNEHKVELKWSTLSEKNNDYFEVQFSKNGIQYETIGVIDGAGNSNSMIEYEFTHENPSGKDSYYRLKQIDNDSQYSISPVVTVEGDQLERRISVVPNPSNGQFRLEATQMRGGEVSITDLTGKVLANKLSENSICSFDLEYLKPGIYIVTWNYLSEQISTRLIIE